MTYDAIVLGTGGVGSSAVYHLAQRGLRVLGLDRFPGGHDRGSSHGETRIIRQAYFEHPDYVPLLRRAYELWHQLEEQRQTRLFEQVGLLQIGAPQGEVVRGVLASAARHQLEIEQLTAAEGMRRFPGFHIPESFAAVFERRAGFLHVEACVRAHLTEALQRGAELRTGEAIRHWRPLGNGFEVETDAGRYQAGRLVISAGAWSSSLLPKSLALRVVRKHLHWFACADPRYGKDQGCPTYFYELPEGCFYGFPALGAEGVKVAEHTGGTEIADPLQDERAPEPLDEQRVRNFLRQYLPGVSGDSTRHDVCYYTLSPDHHFFVDHHPEHAGVVFAAGLSGHGFKFTSVLGEALADMALHGTSPLPLGFLRLGRPGWQAES